MVRCISGWLGQTNGWYYFSFISLAPVSVSIAPNMLIHSSGQVNTINCSSTGIPAPTINFVDIQCTYSDTTNISKRLINNIYIILPFISEIIINNTYIILPFISIINNIYIILSFISIINNIYIILSFISEIIINNIYIILPFISIINNIYIILSFISEIIINNIYIILPFISIINNIYIILSIILLADIITGIFTVQCISERENGLYKVTAVAKITTVAMGGPIELQCKAHNALFNGSDTGTISIYGN